LYCIAKILNASYMRIVYFDDATGLDTVQSVSVWAFSGRKKRGRDGEEI